MSAPDDWPWMHWARRASERSALTVNGNVWSWARLAERVEMLAIGFHRQGVHVGSGVALQAHNSEQALLAYLALLRCGARLLPLNPRLPATQIAALLPSLNIDYALTLSGEAPVTLPALRVISESGFLQHGWQKDAIATLTLTSGSTALPKAAAHTFSAHLASARGVATTLGFSAEESWLLSLPLFHVSGQGILWRWLYSGGRLVLADDSSKQQATFASLVPTQLWRLLRHSELRLRTVLLGGAAIPNELTRQAEERGVACWCGYGMTETASTIAAKRADGGPGVGKPLPGHRIKLVNGEIALQSAALACGYWRDGDLLPLTDSDGWFFTRDSGVWTPDNLLINGRLDNLFFSAGEGIQPEQIEAVLAQHPAVEQVFILPQPDEEYGHRPVALVALRDKSSLLQLQAWAVDRLAGIQRPVSWHPLPQLHGGGIKPSRKQLADWLLQRQKQ
ncbi:o-succinylbenzoate--CoA ligase [Kalamiella sp. sgz302252]|uniref:o-succinylbenzoate--CoA ligase n=1 Tax=Pantoea sp. sgz302252 TaxID=3341827 RepID=UPI0036D32B00